MCCFENEYKQINDMGHAMPWAIVHQVMKEGKRKGCDEHSLPQRYKK